VALLNESVRKKAGEMIEGITEPVKLVVFTQEMDCDHCRDNRTLAEEVAGLSGKLSLEVHNLQLDREKAGEYRVDKVPAICVLGEKDYGIRLYGVPSGYEFTSLLSAIERVGHRDSGLKEGTRRKLAGLSADIDLQVFVTLTCPYCPMMVTLAHRFALESEHITASVVDAGEFPHLANLHNVMAVPKTVINGSAYYEGVQQEEMLLAHLLEAAAGKTD
jgi:glutaredoxin-like protein